MSQAQHHRFPFQYKREVHKDAKFHHLEEFPKRKVVRVLKQCSILYFYYYGFWNIFSFSLLVRIEIPGFSFEGLAVIIHPKTAFLSMFNRHLSMKGHVRSYQFLHILSWNADQDTGKVIIGEHKAESTTFVPSLEEELVISAV